jgi:fumarate reductase subunit C
MIRNAEPGRPASTPSLRPPAPPYVRPMQGWWQRNPFFVRYMVREATAVAVAMYALVLTLGVVCLAAGEAAWNGWFDAMRTPWSIGLHAVLLVAMVVHAKSWFDIMPKTMPMIVVGGRRLSAEAITRGGWAATGLACALLFALAWWWRP